MDLISENRRKLSAVLMRDAVYTRWAATSEFDRNIQEWLRCVAWDQCQSSGLHKREIIINGVIRMGW